MNSHVIVLLLRVKAQLWLLWYVLETTSGFQDRLFSTILERQGNQHQSPPFQRCMHGWHVTVCRCHRKQTPCEAYRLVLVVVPQHISMR